MGASRFPRGGPRWGLLRAAFSALILLSSTAFVALGPAQGALPGEPTAQVTVTPSDVSVDASGLNPVDTALTVNVTGSNIGPRSHTMWVNISFLTSTGWKVKPAGANLTLSLAAAGGTDTKTVSVTVTVPPRVSANNVSVFTASWRAENDLRFSQGQAGNATAQVRVKPIFSTAAEFTNGTSTVTTKQGQDGNFSVKVTNRGNGDATYDAQLQNAADLRPSDIVLKSTTAALVPMNGTGVVRIVVHANPSAIAGTYALQLRVLAGGAGTPPPAGAFADLTGTLLVVAASPPPPTQNNTTQPPPSQNNTTQPPPGNQPPTQPDALVQFVSALTSPVGLIGVVLFAAVAVVGGLVWRRHRRAKRQRKEALERARQKRGVPAGGPRPAGAPGPAGAPAPRARSPLAGGPAGPQGAARPMRPIAQPGARPPSPVSPAAPPTK